MTSSKWTSRGTGVCLLLVTVCSWRCPSAVCSNSGMYSSLDEKPEEKDSKEPFCPYFANRSPRKEPYLKNCTWYMDYSCCHQEEIEMIFDGIPPPYGADERCVKFLNFLMCYVCSPMQHKFYKLETLTVCEDFCDNMYHACADASLKGQRIGDMYTTGREFCVARKFRVHKLNSSDCFTFDPDSYVENKSRVPHVDVGLILPCILLHVFYTYLDFR